MKNVKIFDDFCFVVNLHGQDGLEELEVFPSETLFLRI